MNRDNASHSRAAAPQDLLTVAAIALMVYALSSVIHEGLGHGGACIAFGGVPRLLSSMEFRCDLDGLAPAAGRIVAAAGAIVQIVLGLAVYKTYQVLVTRPFSPASSIWRFGLWLLAAVNLMQGTGYFLFSGVGGIGDWSEVIAGLQPAIAWRALLAIGGFALYWFTTLRLFEALSPFLGALSPERYRRAIPLAVIPYLAGAALSLGAGLLNPAGVALIAISGAAASLGGTSGLAWGPQLLRGRAAAAGTPVAPVSISRSWPVIALGVLVATVFASILGPGVHFQ
ncbi:MAG: hypothetical protein ABI035_07105 [Gemmatimonadaceae bacterium]